MNSDALVTRHHIADNVLRETLPNGLTVLVKESHVAPVVALFASVQAGYFHEKDRWNGIAHVIEHMMFKGTPRRPEMEQVAREVREIGGVVNAGTYYEETSYYIVAPSEFLDKALDIHADMVQNPLFDGPELAKEIEVIVQESLQKRDNPSAMLIESLYALAYDTHRIRRWRIGHPETLRAFTAEDLREFWQDTYRPENIVLSIVGDVDAAKTLEKVRQYWGDMPRGDFRRELSPEETPRQEFRYQRMMGDTKQRLLLLGFPAPSIMHPDAPPLMVLSAILSDGRSARLYRRLKEELRLANSAWASHEGFDQMGIFTLGAESMDDDPLTLEKALWAEIERIKREPVASEEIERIKTRVESRRLYAQEEVMGVARTLATYEALGDYRLTDTMLERLRAVTAEDVQRVASTWLKLEGASLLEYLPATLALPERTPEEIEAALRSQETDNSPLAFPTPLPETEILPDFQIRTSATAHIETEPPAKEIALPGGGTMLYRARRDLPLVAISVLFRGGRRRETQRTSGITNLMLKSGLKGTRRFSAEEIANQIEGLGSGIGMSLAPDYFGYGIKIKRNVLNEGFVLFSEVLTQPIFPEEEVEREKQAIHAEIRRQLDNNFATSFDLFNAACFGNLHPYGLPASGLVEAIEPLQPSDLARWHREHVFRENLTVGIVGDITEEEAIGLFTEMNLPAQGLDSDARSANPFMRTMEPYGEKVVRRQRQQSAAAMGFAGVSIGHEDRYALDMLAEVASGMGGRFFRAVRGDNALAYQVTGFTRSRRDAGNFVTYTSTAPENEERARELLLKECVRLGQEVVSEEEMAAARATLVGEHIIGTQTFGAQAGELASCGINGLPVDEPQRYLARIHQVTAEEIREVAIKYLHPDRYWLGVVRGGAEEDPA